MRWQHSTWQRTAWWVVHLLGTGGWWLVVVLAPLTGGASADTAYNLLGLDEVAAQHWRLTAWWVAVGGATIAEMAKAWSKGHY